MTRRVLSFSQGGSRVSKLCVVPSAGAAKVSSPRIALEKSREPFGAVGAIGDSSTLADPGLVLCSVRKPAAQRFALQRGVARAPRAGVADKRSPEGGAQAAPSEWRPWMAATSVRRRGTGDPEATFEPELQMVGLSVRRYGLSRSHARVRRARGGLTSPSRAFSGRRSKQGRQDRGRRGSRNRGPRQRARNTWGLRRRPGGLRSSSATAPR